MMRFSHFRLFATLLLPFCLFATSAHSETNYPLTFENCGRQITFDKAPERAVTIGQSSTEILFHLGLADKITGTAVWFTEPLPQFAKVSSQIPRLADNDPSFESVIGAKPDLVAAQFLWHLGPEGIVATPEQLTELGINAYISPADCNSKGQKLSHFNIQMIYDEITELAAIFNVSDRGRDLIKELKAREIKARDKISQLQSQKLSAVFWFSSVDVDIDPYVAGRGYAAEYVMNALGIQNVIESSEEWPTVGWETISKSNPDLIIVGKMSRRRFSADDWQVKMQFLTSDPVTRLMPAVQKNRVLAIDAHAMDASIRTIYGIEELAEAVSKYKLGQ